MGKCRTVLASLGICAWSNFRTNRQLGTVIGRLARDIARCMGAGQLITTSLFSLRGTSA